MSYNIPLSDSDIFLSKILMKYLKETNKELIDEELEIKFESDNRPYYLKDLGEVI